MTAPAAAAEPAKAADRLAEAKRELAQADESLEDQRERTQQARDAFAAAEESFEAAPPDADRDELLSLQKDVAQAKSALEAEAAVLRKRQAASAAAQREHDEALIASEAETWNEGRIPELRPVAEHGRESLRDAIDCFTELVRADMAERQRYERRHAHLRQSGRVPPDRSAPRLLDTAALVGLQGPTLRQALAELKRAAAPILRSTTE